MARHDEELLEAARILLRQGKGKRGVLSQARIRRSISTCYYAIFHFVVTEACISLVGAGSPRLRRRRLLARTFTHAGIVFALNKVKTSWVDASVAEYLRLASAAPGPLRSPTFARSMALTLSDTQTKRHEADYDLNATLNGADAHLLISRAEKAIAEWQAADTAAERDFKHALAMLMLLKGQLRKEA